jgi:hypothetical protein
MPFWVMMRTSDAIRCFSQRKTCSQSRFNSTFVGKIVLLNRNRCCRLIALSKSFRKSIATRGTLSSSAYAMNCTATSPRRFTP